MTAEPQTAEEIFYRALELEEDAQGAFLAIACGDNRQLRQEVDQLIADHQQAGDFLKNPAAVVPTEALPVTESPGTVIGRYKLLEQIGEGGMGVVFMAEQETPVRRKVALKIIKPGMDSKEVIARFEAERQALALMDHPNIARVFDAGATEAGRPYFVMELVRGVPMTIFCDRNSLTAGERLELFIKVCQAVQHAHQKGIIHRDIKPTNILVTMHDDRPVPKVIDFGVAKATNARLTERTLFTRFAQMVGTPLYMSPEQAQMSGLDVDTRSDIYSLGVLLYELLTGTTPFDQKRVREAAHDELLRMIREEEPPRPSLRISSLGETLPSVAAHRKIDPNRLSSLVRGELDWIVMKAIEKDRTRRYATASALAEDIQHHLRDEPVEACPPSAVYRMKKFVRRNKLAVLASVCATAATLVGLSLTILVNAKLEQKNADLTDANKQRVEQSNRADAEAKAAKHAQSELERQAYGLIMLAAFQAWETADPERAKELLLEVLSRQRSAGEAPDLAWRFLWTRCHEGLPNTIDFKGQSHCIAYSPDGNYLAVGLVNGEVVLHHFETGKSVSLPKPDNSPLARRVVECLDFTPSGDYLVAGGGDTNSEGFVCLWELATRQPAILPIQHSGSVLDIAVSPDGRLGASVSTEHIGSFIEETIYTYRVWTLPSGSEQRCWTTRLKSHKCHPQTAFLPGSPLLLAGSGEGGVQFWNIDSGVEVESMKVAPANQIFALSSDGGCVLGGSGDISGSGTSSVIRWDLTGDIPQVRDELTWTRCDAFAFSPDGSLMAARDRDSSKVLVWFRENGNELAQLLGGYELPSDYGVASLVFSPDGNQVALGRGNVKIWDLSMWKRNRFDGLGQVAAIFPSTSRSAVAVADKIHGERRTYQIDFPIQERGESFGAFMATSSDGSRFVTQDETGAIRIWDAQTGMQLMVLDGSCCPPVSLSRDGRFVAANGIDNTICVWDVDSQELIRRDSYLGTLKDRYDVADGGRTVTPVTLAISPHGGRLVTIINNDDKEVSVELWELATGERRALASYTSFEYVGAAFSPNEKYLVVTPAYPELHGGEIHLWELGATAPNRLPSFPGLDRLMRLRFSPNDDLLVVAGRAPGDLLLCDIRDNKTIQLSRTTGAWVNCLAFSSDGKTLVTGSLCGKIKFWKMPTGEELGTLNLEEQVAQLELIENEHLLATMSFGGTAKLWPIVTADEVF